MQFDPPLQPGTLQQRYKRFLADIVTDDGQALTLHCPNTGSMKGCAEPGSRIWYASHEGTRRKYPHGWELVEFDDGHFACINTARPNRLVEAAIEADTFTELTGYAQIRREQRYGEEGSRIDLLLSGHAALPDAYVEVKNVTLLENGCGYFPDAVSSRGQKHLRELRHVAEAGLRAVLVFCVSHTAISEVRPAWHIDPEYARLLVEAAEAGVQILAWGATISPQAIQLTRSVPVNLAAPEADRRPAKSG